MRGRDLVPAVLGLGILTVAIGISGCVEDEFAWQGQADRFAEWLPVRGDLNVIIVSFDALRADALGCYGYPLRVSPRIDEFARRSLLFESAYSASPNTPTSFAAALTGMYPTRVFRDWKLAEVQTLPQVFAAGGYRTAALFNSAQLSPARNFDLGWQHYDFHLLSEDELILGRAISWLEENRHQRFLFWVHFVSPHAPYDYREMSEHLYEAGYTGPFEQTSGFEFEAMERSELLQLRRLYDGEVYYLDDLFGRLMSELEEANLLGRSLILLTSDHGEEFLEHGGVQHTKLYEETIRIPLILYHPDLPSGKRTPVPFMNVDLLPTLAAITSVPFQGEVDGKNLLDPRDRRDRIVAVSYSEREERALALRRGRMKVVLSLNFDPEDSEGFEVTRELFDLGRDPAETANLADDYRDISTRLGNEVWNLLGRQEALIMGKWTDPLLGLDPETLEALRALGYLEVGKK